MIKKVSVLALAFALMVGCTFSTNMKLMFNVETGDKIYVEVDTTDGYKMTADAPFSVTKDGAVQLQGTFIYEAAFQAYADAAAEDPDARIIERSSKNGNQYVFWSYAEEEYNIVMFVGGSSTGVLMSSTVSEEAAREAFNRMTFSLS